MNTKKLSDLLEKVWNMSASVNPMQVTPLKFANAGLNYPIGSGVLISVEIYGNQDGDGLDVWIADGSKQAAYVAIYSQQTIIPISISSELNDEESLVSLVEEQYWEAMSEISQSQKESRASDMDDDDRIDCPFCGKMHYPGARTAELEEWTWDEASICEHLLFLAVDVSAYSGFQYRSKLFLQHLNVPDSDDGELRVPSKEDPEEYLTVSEIIDLVTLPGLKIRSYEDPGGIACGPVGGGTVTFGFIPGSTAP